MEFVSEWRLEGRAEGRIEGKAEGKAEGIREGKVALLLLQMTRRFGTLPTDMEARIQALSSAQLDDLSLALLDFAGLPDAKAWVDGTA